MYCSTKESSSAQFSCNGPTQSRPLRLVARHRWVGCILISLVVVPSAYAGDKIRDGLRIRTSRSTGLATFVSPADHKPIPLTTARGGAQPTALDFVNKYGDLFGVSDPATQLLVSRATTDSLGHIHTKYEQVHRGVEVFGGVLLIHQNATGSLVAANGHFFPHPTGVKYATDRLRKSSHCQRDRRNRTRRTGGGIIPS